MFRFQTAVHATLRTVAAALALGGAVIAARAPSAVAAQATPRAADPARRPIVAQAGGSMTTGSVTTSSATTGSVTTDSGQPAISWTWTPVTATPGEPRGYVEFQRACSVCHGSGPAKPGTRALRAKYGGKLPALLEQRTDLAAAYVRYVVRHGVSVMPPFRKTELSDADLDAIAAYLSRERLERASVPAAHEAAPTREATATPEPMPTHEPTPSHEAAPQ